MGREQSERRAAAVAKAPGDLLSDRYLLEGELGRGGFGVVFRARDVRLDKRVAVKVLSAAVAETPVALARFKQEATSAARVGHKGIVDVTDVGEDEDGTHFIVMELIEGMDLGYLLRSEGSLPLSRSLAIGARVAQALAAAHEKGIIHRDLKPGNILLTSLGPVTDFVKILDFGVSKITQLGERTDTLTLDGQVVGTPRYMAPEQGVGDAVVDARADVYALGTILYEMVTGHLPYTGSTHYEVIHNKLSVDPLPPSVINPDIESPLEFEALVMTALERDPDARYASMAEFELVIRELLEEVDPVAASGVRPAAPTPQPRMPNTGANSSASVSTRLVRNPTRPTRTTGTTRTTTPPSVVMRARAAKRAERRRRKLRRGILIGGAVVALAAAVLIVPRLLGSGGTNTNEARPAPEVGEQPAKTPEAPVEPASVEIRFALEPADARVEIDGVVASQNPVELPRSSASHVAVVSAPGYKSERKSFQALVDGELHFSLQREEEPVAKPPRRPKPHKSEPRLPDSPL